MPQFNSDWSGGGRSAQPASVSRFELARRPTGRGV